MSEQATYTKKTSEEIKQLASDFLAGRLFSTDHIRLEELEQMTTTVFMVLLFSGPDFASWLKDNDITFVYEYLDKAGPTSINGYPIFFSARFLNGEDHRRMLALAEKLETAVQEVSE